MREQRLMMWLMVVMVLVVIVLTFLSLQSSTKHVNMEKEEKRMNIAKEAEKVNNEERERKTAPEEEKKKQKEEEKKDQEETKEEGKEKRGKVRGVQKNSAAQNFWVNEMEKYSPSSVNMAEMEEEMRRRRRRLEERCGEILTEEERKKEINSKEFFISEKYKLIWCNIFKAASSTWLYNYLRMAGRSPEQLKKLKIPLVEAARRQYPRPSPEQLRDHLERRSGRDEDAGKDYLSFIIVREPFQRLLSAYRDKIEKILPYYKSLRCEMTHGTSTTRRLLEQRKPCTPSFPQFVDYVLKTEQQGGAHNEHWAPYYRFCTPCSAHFDLILRFESLHQDEAYLLEKVPGLSKVVSPMVIHSSHSNYSSILTQYYRELTPGQMLSLIKMYLPDFWLFGYNERPYMDLV